MSALDPARLDALRKLAEAATPGPNNGHLWEVHDNCVFDEGRCVARLDWDIRDEIDVANAVYIAAMSPDTTLALLAERAGFLARIAELEAGRVEDHKWFDPRCHFHGCRSLTLEAALKRLSFAAQTTGGTAGRDEELVAAIEQAEAALLPKASVREEPKTEWLAEMASKSGSLSWWSLMNTAGDGGYFSENSREALRFARREDAQAFIDDAGWTAVRPMPFRAPFERSSK